MVEIIRNLIEMLAGLVSLLVNMFPINPLWIQIGLAILIGWLLSRWRFIYNGRSDLRLAFVFALLVFIWLLTI